MDDNVSIRCLQDTTLGDYTKSVKLATEVIAICKKNHGIDYPDYLPSLNNLAVNYSALGKYSEALRMNTEVMEILKRKLGVVHPNYALSLFNISSNYFNLGYYEESLKFGLEAMEIFKRILGVEHPSYAKSLMNLADIYSKLGNYSDALKMNLEAMDILKRTLGVEHPSYAQSLMDLAFIYSKLGNYSEAFRMNTEVMEILKRTHGVEHRGYAKSLMNLAIRNCELDNYSEALRIGTIGLEIMKKDLGVYDSDYAQSLVILAYINFELSNYSEVVNNIAQASDIISNTIVNDYFNFSSQRMQKYWDANKRLFFEDIPKYAGNTSDSTLTQLLYDKSALLAKGILLNTEREINSFFEESGDVELINDYQTVLSNYELFHNQTELPISKRCIDTDSLLLVTKKIEDKIVHKSRDFSDYIQNNRLTWKDILHSLGDKDLAIEFFDIPVDRDKTKYMALTLRKGSDFPKTTALFEEKQLKLIPDTLYYQCKEMTDLVWGPLLPELQGIKNIYFSPSGALHKIGIEYLPGMEEYNLFRLSSTRELVTKKKKQSEDRAVLYGGLDYYAKIDTIGNDKSQSMLVNKYVEHANVRGMKLRGGKEYLPHTKEEVEQIATELRNAKWTCQLDTLDKGTEESFKSLSGKRVNTMHISTHGFYYTPEEADKMGYDFLSLDNQRASTEDKALTRTGLIMSGANHILEGEELPDNVEDGILTAKEIADIDLRGLDLVVLSACQTGLGDISQGEGVFGLQRGFKKAGAKTILMSLWEVDDKATQILMTQFYKNLLAGQSKRQSLLSAQKYLREVENGKYNDPKYWASFILLDGLDI